MRTILPAIVALLYLAGCGPKVDQSGGGPSTPPAKAVAVTTESVGGRWKSGKMVLELCEDGKAVVHDTQTVWPLDQPEKKEDITTDYVGTWNLADSVLEITFTADGKPPLLRGGRYRTSLEQDRMTMNRLDGATVLDGPSWVRLP